VQGSFKDPAFFPSASALLRGAVSLALLPSAPIAALISLLEAEDDEENVHCSGLVDAINEARQSE
jgi:AsmA family protein